MRTSAHTNKMGSKQDELQTCIQSQGFDLIVVTEMWWNSSCDWNVGIRDYTLFRRDRPGRQGGGIVLCVRQWNIRSSVLVWVMNLQVRIKGQT